MSATLLALERKWWCPRCVTTDVTHKSEEHVQFHHCPGMGGLWVPMLPKGQKGHLLIKEREDYAGTDTVTTVDGKAIQSVEVLVGHDQKHLVIYAGTGNVRVSLDEVEDLCPKQVQRKGRASMRAWLSTHLRRSVTARTMK